MPAWKLIMVAAKARRGWKRIPPERRRQLVQSAGETARKHGPVIAKRIGTAVREARKRR
jgi:acyl-CoA reductase-like NAD-dependent aldehyde dehydrogenase